MRIEYHRTLIADTVRNDALYRALKAVIVPAQSVVADIGAGTGLLGIMASKLGAKTVYLFETAEVAGVAAKLIKANRVKNCHLIPCHSTEFQDRLAVDVIVSETLGNYALEENIVATLVDAKRRYLKPKGIMIPHQISQFVAPVIAPRIHHDLTVWDRMGYDVDFSIAQAMTLNNAYVRTIPCTELLDQGASAALWDEIDLLSDVASSRKGEARWKMRRAETVYGFATWWRARLHGDIVLSTAPDAPQTHWEQLYFPLISPMSLKTGESVVLILKSRSSEAAGTHMAWTAIHFDAKGQRVARQSLDLDKGYLP
ncbi:MAG: ribonucleotide-diphosphate reductase subunit beta [Hyphomicrobium sp.]|nr:MAG: ribonucleotide-diphosphate reductase subunit beta [Hyphomicrobium sp.]